MVTAIDFRTERSLGVMPEEPLDLLPQSALVVVAMSGGVDSSVAAARLVDRGIKTIGITLAMWPRSREIEQDRGCCSVDAVDDARKVATKLGIDHYPWNLEEEFNHQVITEFEDQYAAGQTPNPCVSCNQRIKFGILLERAMALGATHVATGHYAQIGRRDNDFTLHRAANFRKDQSYTLHRVEQAQLSRAIFPLGAISSKDEVRQLAAKYDLITAAKQDSQELCFVNDNIRTELEQRLAGRYQTGKMVTKEGKVIGEHRGLPFYTIGQRSGLGLAPDTPDATPAYVINIDANTNQVVVGEHQDLYRTKLWADDCRWISTVPQGDRKYDAQIRAHGTTYPVLLEKLDNDNLELSFDPPAMQVSPGQPVALYDQSEVLGGGIIRAAV